MSERTPSIQTIAGSGTPRLVLIQSDVTYTSSGTVAFTATSITETGSPSYASVSLGQRVLSNRVVSGLGLPTYAKITAKAAGVLTIDGWTNGTPTDSSFIVDGWIADMPRCQELTEIFEPDVLVHSLYRGDMGSSFATKHRGWRYTCVLDYSKYISADAILSLRRQLAQRANDNLVLIPRNDQPKYQYNVFYGKPVELSRYGISAGYKKMVLAFTGKENLASWPLIDGYGTNYANAYGTGL